MAVAAKRLLGKNKWPELLQFVYQYSQSEVEEQRELAFIILNELAEALGKSFEGQFAQLKQVYQGALQDPRSRKVRSGFGIRGLRLALDFVCDQQIDGLTDSYTHTIRPQPHNPLTRCKWRRSRRARRC